MPRFTLRNQVIQQVGQLSPNTSITPRKNVSSPVTEATRVASLYCCIALNDAPVGSQMDLCGRMGWFSGTAEQDGHSAPSGHSAVRRGLDRSTWLW